MTLQLIQNAQCRMQNGIEQRWVARLANYDYTIHYRPGHHNANADALSRKSNQQSEPPGDPEELKVPKFQPPAASVQPPAPAEPPLSAYAHVNCNQSSSEGFAATLPGWTLTHWQQAQQEDEALRRVVQILQQKACLPNQLLKRQSPGQFWSFSDTGTASP